MHKKTIFITAGILMSALLFAVLFLVLSDIYVKAAPSSTLHAELRDGRIQRRTIGEEVAIVEPTAGDILTTTHQPTYTVKIDVGIAAPPKVVSVSVDSGVTYHEATKAHLGTYNWGWSLPVEDYEEHRLVARAGYPTGEPLSSDPVTIHVDTIPPQGTVITIPAQAEPTGFTVSWSATDGSGEIAYDIQYQRDDEESWTSWLTGSSENSKVFSDTLERGYSYTFRMRARDKGHNPSGWTEATVKVARFHVYLPLTLRQWSWWYQYDHYEPNETPSQAWGPLEPDTVYEAYIWNQMDQDDYYHFTPTSQVSGDVEINLTNIPEGKDYDLYVYYYSHISGKYVQEAESYEPGSSDERVAFTPVPARKYFVRVYPSVGFSNAQPYHLELTYGAGD
jgi:hypothetical protein